MPNIDSMKRAARKEAWYGDSYNPFRKSRSSTWSTQRDEEHADGSTLTHFHTEPVAESPRMDNDDDIAASNNPPLPSTTEPTMTAARTSEPGGSSAAASAEKEKENIQAADDQIIPEADGKPRRRKFMPGFLQKDTVVDGEEVEKKRPWYKGKNLYHAEPFTVRNQLQRTIFGSYVNILLLAAPVGIAVNYAGINGKVVFVVNFIAIIPLAGLLSFATEEIALHVGESVGGLLNASFGCVSPPCPWIDKVIMLTTSVTRSR